MNSYKLERKIESVCLVSSFIVLFAFKDIKHWNQTVGNKNLIWHASEIFAVTILFVALAISIVGVLIIAIRLVKYLLKRPSLKLSVTISRAFLKAPCDTQPWINPLYGLLGFMSFGIPLKLLMTAGLLGCFFSATIRSIARKRYESPKLGATSNFHA